MNLKICQALTSLPTALYLNIEKWRPRRRWIPFAVLAGSPASRMLPGESKRSFWPSDPGDDLGGGGHGWPWVAWICDRSSDVVNKSGNKFPRMIMMELKNNKLMNNYMVKDLI